MDVSVLLNSVMEVTVIWSAVLGMFIGSILMLYTGYTRDRLTLLDCLKYSAAGMFIGLAVGLLVGLGIGFVAVVLYTAPILATIPMWLLLSALGFYGMSKKRDSLDALKSKVKSITDEVELLLSRDFLDEEFAALENRLHEARRSINNG